jgi:DNA-binding beta-propeller fold protein YncE
VISFGRLTFFLLALPGAVGFAQTSVFTSPLPTGVRLDAVGGAVELGSMPLNVVPALSGDKAVVVLGGWREQGIQVVDLKTRQVTQTLLQDGAFYCAAFSPDGSTLYVSGGNTDMLFIYSWKDGTATLRNKLELAKAKTPDGTGTSYPAGVAVAPNGKFVYVAENVGNRLAVVDAVTGEIVQRFPTDQYPYGVILGGDDRVFVSAWGSTTISDFRVRPDGKLAYLGARRGWRLVTPAVSRDPCPFPLFQAPPDCPVRNLQERIAGERFRPQPQPFQKSLTAGLCQR